MKIFHALTQQLTLAAFKGSDPTGTPMLNEIGGALCYTDFEACVRASIDISETVETTAPLTAVVHIELDDSLFEQLVNEGHIIKSGENESLGKPLYNFTGYASGLVNARATFTASFHKLNPVITKKFS